MRDLCAAFSNIEKIEWLPFKNICAEKYEALGIPFPMAGKPAYTQKHMICCFPHSKYSDVFSGFPLWEAFLFSVPLSESNAAKKNGLLKIRSPSHKFQ